MLEPAEPLRWASCHGLKISLFDDDELAAHFLDAVRRRRQTVCYGYSLTLLPRFAQLPHIHRISETFQVMTADGKGFFWLCRWLGIPVRSDATITDAMQLLFRLADEHRLKVMLLGSEPDANRRATERVRADWPRADVLEGHHGFFSLEEEPAVVDLINRRRPDILMLGMSSPKKEEFVERHRARLDVPVILLIGGNIDMLSGRVRPIPRWIKKAGVTWIYRIVQEPRRLGAGMLRNAGSVVFRLFPRLFWEHVVRRNAGFSIPRFYGVP